MVKGTDLRSVGQKPRGFKSHRCHFLFHSLHFPILPKNPPTQFNNTYVRANFANFHNSHSPKLHPATLLEARNRPLSAHKRYLLWENLQGKDEKSVHSFPLAEMQIFGKSNRSDPGRLQTPLGGERFRFQGSALFLWEGWLLQEAFQDWRIPWA